ncbi:DUF998 domain-containing protein [Microlunatus elymi]|uniref:DUF998 domain-containing protein n=1 Tax=Microlunatus elymi TaxID=2596828 RepID=A0A516Q2L5_9ACTN|nr:DUF998 domain-containing protein [Microlunatus elymi]
MVRDHRFRDGCRVSENIRLVAVLSAIALVPMVAAHVLGAATINPLIDPISWYAFIPGGAFMIMAGGSLLALLGVILTVRMYRARLATGPVPALAMIIFSTSLILVGIFPTNPPHTDPTVAATIHRVAAGSAFAALPLAGLKIAASIHGPCSALPRALRRSAIALAGLVGAFLAIHIPLAIAGSGIAAFGFLERAGFVIMISYLFLLAATIDREGVSYPAEADVKVLRQTSSQGVGASPSLVSASVESTTYDRVKI